LILTQCTPGQPLSEQELAKLLGVSRTPVREALFRLEREGLIRTVPHKGSFVATLTVQDIHDLFEVREALELYAVRRAVERLDLHELEKIQEEANRIHSGFAPQISSEEKYRALSGVFDKLHRVILATCGNRRLIVLLESVRGMWDLARKVLTRRIAEEDVIRTFAEHTEIIEALKAQAPEAAERAMQIHLANSRRRFLAAVRP
jgi:DNA-binding GntR family transcriptional regulator